MAVKALSDDDMPEYARRCRQDYLDATSELREAEKESIGMWIGGKLQWRPQEIANRQGNNLPWMSINRCQPAVSQIENEARNNPPGPQAHPVGGGADRESADIVEGIIREYEYRSNANESARIPALRYAAAGGRGCWELATEYSNERSLKQRLVVKPIHDPGSVFWDPNSVLPCGEDAMWGGQLLKLSREQVVDQFGDKLKILESDAISRFKQSAGNWIADAFPKWEWARNESSLLQWGANSKYGPYFVCKFWRVVSEKAKVTPYDDGVNRFEDEDVPKGVKPKEGLETRWSPRRRVMRYTLTALDVIAKTEWYGSCIPIFWITGPEIWRDEQRYRLSAITGAMDAQRGLNYGATSGATILGLMSKSPFTGVQGSFDVVNAQGQNPWESSNKTPWAFMEYAPVWVTNPANPAQSELAPAPTRNPFEINLSGVLEWMNAMGEAIKAATSVFFEPSLTSAKNAQSGAAIKELQSQTNIGTANWQAGLQMATALEYHQAMRVARKIYSGTDVLNIVRPDGNAEAVEVNREFPPLPSGLPDGQREGTKHRRANGKLESYNDIEFGEHALRVTAGPDFATEAEEAQGKLIDLIKLAPGIVQNPAALAKLVRIVGQGNPEIESLADILDPQGQQQTPEQLQAALQQVNTKNQQLMKLVQAMQQAIASKQPEIDARKWETAIEQLTKIEVAKITASKDADSEQADREAELLGNMIGMAHETALQKDQQAHEAGMQADQQSAAAQQQQVAAQQEQGQPQQ